MLMPQLPGAAVGRLREGMLIGYDNKRMTGLWPTKDMCEGYKYALTPNLVTLEVIAQVIAQLTLFMCQAVILSVLKLYLDLHYSSFKHPLQSFAMQLDKQCKVVRSLCSAPSDYTSHVHAHENINLKILSKMAYARMRRSSPMSLLHFDTANLQGGLAGICARS